MATYMPLDSVDSVAAVRRACRHRDDAFVATGVPSDSFPAGTV